MTKLEQLIKELCPNGVEYVELRDILDYEQPQKYIVKSTKYNASYDIPVLTAGQTFILGYTNEEQGVYKASVENPVIIFDDFTTSFHWVDFNFKIKSSAMKILKPNDSDKSIFRYAYYVMQTIKYAPYGHTRQWIENYSRIQIPLPPLAVQREIVRILDKFTLYSQELAAELAARKKQYEFYRDRLLHFQELDVEWKTIDEIAYYRRGSFPQPYTNRLWYGGEGAMPFVQVADVAEEGMRLVKQTKQTISKIAQPKSIFVKKGTVIVTLQGSIGRVAITQYDSYVDRTLAIFYGYKTDIDKKYFAYQLLRKFGIEKESARGSTLKTITKEEFSKFKIPVPPLEVQERIVKVLDNFDAICSDLGIGLPAEIEKRQQQYEFYRDKLLTFGTGSATIFTDRPD